MKVLILLGLIAGTLSAQTTNTSCQTNGNQTNCTSTQDNSYENGRAAGSAIGNLIFGSVAKHNQVSNYCKFHPGEAWHNDNYTRAGTCKVETPKASKVSNSTADMHFQPYSQGAKAWCAHQPSNTAYQAEGNVYSCKGPFLPSTR